MIGLETLKRYFYRFLGRNVHPSINEYKKWVEGIGNNVDILCSNIDMLLPELLSIGDNVTITHATVLTHDASTRKTLGYTKFGKVTIGSDVFIGAGAIILPGTTIGDKVIVGAGAVVASDIPNNSVYIGNPAKLTCTYDEYMARMKSRLDNGYIINELPCNLSKEARLRVRDKVTSFGTVFLR